ncbi:ubiquitin-like domain-containing protein [Streptomyces sp. NPDC048272]|uniref:ubiquitin-like domain-containing protein n=1 Tax=Streptomyces sp. NPDC048272 TaxID=3154616 RepID=UPI003431A928
MTPAPVDPADVTVAAAALPGAPVSGVPAPRSARRRKAPEPGWTRGRGRDADTLPSPYDPPPEEPAGPGRRRRQDTPPGPAPAAYTADLDTLVNPAAPGSGRRRGADAAPEAPGEPAAGRRRRALPPTLPPGPASAGPTGAGPTPTVVDPVPARPRRSTGAAADTWRRIVPQALVVAFLAGGTTAFVAADKAVRLTVDGVPRSLHTFADGVDELLAAEGLGVGPHDLVAPARGSALDDGEDIVVRYGRPLTLTLDGERRQVWTTSRTVEGALRQLGIRAEGAHLSAPRTTPVPRSGLTLNVRTERGVTFLADGRETTVRTNAATIQEALDQAGITLHGQDSTSVPPTAFPRDGQIVTVLRITGTREVREERIPYEVERVRDDSLFAGTEIVERAGRPGTRRVTYGLRTVNGVRQKPRRLADEIVRAPVNRLVKVGTKALPDSVAGADGLDWGALARCESGGRAAATDPSGTYGGLYQFDVRTWQALGGSGRPQDAAGTEQTYRAKKLYVQRGATPWPHCGRRLYR